MTTYIVRGVDANIQFDYINQRVNYVNPFKQHPYCNQMMDFTFIETFIGKNLITSSLCFVISDVGEVYGVKEDLAACIYALSNKGIKFTIYDPNELNAVPPPEPELVSDYDRAMSIL